MIVEEFNTVEQHKIQIQDNKYKQRCDSNSKCRLLFDKVEDKSSNKESLLKIIFYNILLMKQMIIT